MKKCSHCGKKSAFARERREGEKEVGGGGGGGGGGRGEHTGVA